MDRWKNQKLSKNHRMLLEMNALMEVLDDSTSAQVACLKSEVECVIESIDVIGAVFC